VVDPVESIIDRCVDSVLGCPPQWLRSCRDRLRRRIRWRPREPPREDL